MDSDKWTEKELDRLEKRINEAYEEASKELGQKAQEYFSQYQERFKREELAMLTSSLSEEEVRDKWVDLYGNDSRFDAWYRTANHAYGATKELAETNFKRWEYSQLGRGQHWNDMRDQMAERLTETNKIAEGYINGVLPKVYVANSNGVAEIAQASAMSEGVTGIRFDLADEYTVRRLMMESSDVRPYKPVNVSVDESTRWSKNKLQNALLQGILQGDSIEHIADRFQTVTNMNRASAIRNARTATTNAQSAGKQDRFNDLAKQGCVFSKIWKATADERTREEHWEADGQEVDFDQTFEVGGELLMYPADPVASGWNRYNCRCTIRTGKPRFKSVLSDQAREDANIRIVEQSQQNVYNGYKYAPKSNTDLQRNLNDNYYNGMVEAVSNCNDENLVKVWSKYEDKVKIGDANYKGREHCQFGKVYINQKSDLVGNSFENPFGVFFHESGHSIDYLAAREIGQPMHYSRYYKDGLFPKTIIDEVNELVSATDKRLKEEFKLHKNDVEWMLENGIISQWKYDFYKQNGTWVGGEPKYSKSIAYKTIENQLKEIPLKARGDISDMFEGATGGKISAGIGHGKSYWSGGVFKNDPLATEAFAEMTSANMTNPESLETIKQYLPKSYSVYNEMLEDLAGE